MAALTENRLSALALPPVHPAKLTSLMQEWVGACKSLLGSQHLDIYKAPSDIDGPLSLSTSVTYLLIQWASLPQMSQTCFYSFDTQNQDKSNLEMTP